MSSQEINKREILDFIMFNETSTFLETLLFLKENIQNYSDDTLTIMLDSLNQTDYSPKDYNTMSAFVETALYLSDFIPLPSFKTLISKSYVFNIYLFKKYIEKEEFQFSDLTDLLPLRERKPNIIFPLNERLYLFGIKTNNEGESDELLDFIEKYPNDSKHRFYSNKLEFTSKDVLLMCSDTFVENYTRYLEKYLSTSVNILGGNTNINFDIMVNFKFIDEEGLKMQQNLLVIIQAILRINDFKVPRNLSIFRFFFNPCRLTLDY